MIYAASYRPKCKELGEWTELGIFRAKEQAIERCKQFEERAVGEHDCKVAQFRSANSKWGKLVWITGDPD